VAEIPSPRPPVPSQVPLVPTVPATAPAQPARSTASPWLVGCLIAAIVGAILAVGAAGVMYMHFRAPAAQMPAPVGGSIEVPAAPIAPDAQQPAPAPPPVAPAKPAPPPISAEDPVAEAQVVLEDYLAVDLAHDGEAMAKFLGGQAAARFRPDVQGQEDVVVSSETVAGHEVHDANTIVFRVTVKWSQPGGPTQTTTDRYVVRKTDEGWKITSTPAYPED
jgi:hypothetical protein